MSLYRTALLSAAALSALPSRASLTSGNYATKLDDDTDDQLWNSFNASSTLVLPGPNVTQERYGDEAVDWTLRLTVTPDIAIPDEEGKYFTGSQVVLLPPEEIRGIPESSTRINPVYGFCFGIPAVIAVDDDEEEDEVDGTCQGVVPDECLDALREVVEDPSLCENYDTLPRVCRENEHIKNELDSGIEVFGTWSNSTKRNVYYRTDNGEAHKQGDTAAYDKAIRQTYIVLTGTVGLREERSPSPVEFRDRIIDGTKIFGNVSCIRASEFAAEARDYEDAAAFLSPTAWPIVGAIVGILFTLL